MKDKNQKTKDWEIKKLKDVCYVVTDGVHKTPKYTDSGVRFISIKNIRAYSPIDFNSYVRYISQADHEDFSKKAKVEINDILFPRIGTMGFAKIVDFEEEVSIFVGLGLAKPNSDIILPKYLEYYMNSDFVYRYSHEKATGSGRKTLSLKFSREMPVFFPKSLDEQKRIVEILDEAFENIDQAKNIAEQNLKNIEELFESELQNIFSNNGDEWERNTLGEVCEMIKRGSAPKYTEKEESTIVLNQKCIRNHSINYSFSRKHDSSVKKINQERFIQLGDGLINSTGVGTLGRVAQVREIEVEAFVDTHITIVRPKKELFFLDFFGWILIFIENKIKESGEGASGQTELSRTKLEDEFYVSYPKSITEQQKIVERLDELKEKVDDGAAILRSKIAALDELKKSLLQKAFNGEL